MNQALQFETDIKMCDNLLVKIWKKSSAPAKFHIWSLINKKKIKKAISDSFWMNVAEFYNTAK